MQLLESMLGINIGLQNTFPVMVFARCVFLEIQLAEMNLLPEWAPQKGAQLGMLVGAFLCLLCLKTLICGSTNIYVGCINLLIILF